MTRLPLDAWLARLLWLACLLLSIYLFVATIDSRQRQMQDLVALNSVALDALGVGRDFLPTYMRVLDGLTFVITVLVGVLIFARKASQRIGRIGSISLITAAFTMVRPPDALFFVNPGPRLPILLLFALGTGSLLLFLYLFPDGHARPRWTLWPALILGAIPVGAFLQQMLSLGSAPWPPPNVSATTLPAIGLAIAVQVYRYRRVADRSQQQQTKWVVFGLVLAALGMFAFLIVVPFLAPEVRRAGIQQVIYIAIGVPLFYLAMMLLPLSLAMSILRYRLWDIDLLIRRTLLYGMLTAAVAGLFTASIAVGQRFFLALTGQQSDVAIFLATLLVVTAFTPLKDWLQHRLDKRLKTEPSQRNRLRAYIDQVNSRLSPVDPFQVCRRLLDESVAAFDAKGGMVVWDVEGGIKPVYQTAGWDGQPRATAFFQSAAGAPSLGLLLLSARREGEEYGEHDQAELQEASAAVALAIEQDRPSAARREMYWPSAHESAAPHPTTDTAAHDS